MNRLLSLLLITALFFSCSDVPLSYNTSLTDRRLLGYWQSGDSIAMVFRLNSAGQVVYNQYEYEENTNELKPGFKKDVPVFFTDLSRNGQTYHFISVKHAEGEFQNARFYINSTGDLILAALNDDSFAQPGGLSADGKFGTSERLLASVRGHLTSPGTYAPDIRLIRRNNASSFIKRPEKTIDVDTASWQLYKPDYGTLTFSYPPGWEVGKNDRTGNAFNENYFIQPKGQDFNGQMGETVIRIFDPVSIMEDTHSLSSAYSLTLFNKFVAQMAEGHPSETTTFTNNGHSYFQSLQYNSGYATQFIGSKSPNGNLYVTVIAMVPYLSAEKEAMLFKVIESMRGGEPPLNPTIQETVARDWYTALGQGDAKKLESLSCAEARQSNALVELAERLFNMPDTRNGIGDAAKRFDFSNLRFYTVGGNSSLVVVRVCGNVVSPTGEIKSFYNYARMMGNTNLFVVKLENGSWKLCQSVGR